jgi:cytochrome c oxidase accessory protein FixG
MFDRNTLIIAYDPMRGEPRGARRRGLGSVLERARGLLDASAAYDYVFRANRHPSAADARAQARGTIALRAAAGTDAPVAPLPKFAPEELGDCIDCTLCVQVCPTGIDIRNGLQYECIACGACIDACDDVMGKLGYPRGLIRYSTQNAIDGRPTRIVRPRLIVYATLLVALVGGWGLGVALRSPLHVDVLRDRNALYRPTDSGSSNGYLLKIANKTDRAQRYTVEVVDGPAAPRAPVTIEVPAEQIAPLPVELYAGAAVHGRHDVTFAVTAGDGTRVQVESTYFGPER